MVNSSLGGDFVFLSWCAIIISQCQSMLGNFAGQLRGVDDQQEEGRERGGSSLFFHFIFFMWLALLVPLALSLSHKHVTHVYHINLKLFEKKTEPRENPWGPFFFLGPKIFEVLRNIYVRHCDELGSLRFTPNRWVHKLDEGKKKKFFFSPHLRSLLIFSKNLN